MLRTALLALALLAGGGALAQTGSAAGGSGTAATSAPSDRANRPGGTSQISPAPGPATAPALPGASLPPAAVENRDKAEAAKGEKKAEKKAAKKAKKTKKSKPASTGSAASSPANGTAPAAK